MDITITNGQLSASIKSHGAELSSLQSNGREYMWEGDPKHWGKHSPVLFPIVGTLKNNVYTYNGVEYSLSRHGFARDMEFIVKEQSAASVTFALRQHDDTLAVYPFAFELLITYTLNSNSLNIEYGVANPGNIDLLFSIGAHPAFALPQPFEDYKLIFEKEEQPQSFELENDLLSDKTKIIAVKDGVLPLSYDLFAKDALIFKSLESESLVIIESGKPLLEVKFSDFPHLGLWTKTGAPFLCIEPWQGYSDTSRNSGELAEKEGIVHLPPGEIKKIGFSIEIF